MTAAARAVMTTIEADRWHEGWNAGRRAARFLLLTMESETDKAAQRTLAAAGARVETMARPACTVVLERADSLTAAIRAALALNRAGLTLEAVAILEDALR